MDLKWHLLRKIDKKRLFLYFIAAAGIIASLVVFSIFQLRTNQRAWKDFQIATSYYQQGQNAKSREERLKKYKEAKVLYEKILSKYPWAKNKREVLFYLGNCLYLSGDYDQASKVLERFKDKYRDDYFSPWVEEKLVSTYEQKKEYKKAIETYQEMLEKYLDSPVTPQALLGIARCQELQKAWNKARESYEELLSRYPLSEEATIGETQIQRLKAEGKIP